MITTIIVVALDAVSVAVAEDTVEVVAVATDAKQQVVLQYCTASAVSHESKPRVALHTVALCTSGNFMNPE